MTANESLAASGISKGFPGTTALDSVDLAVRRGEIHALVGGNGSGKSTLIKILSGVYQADPGGRIVCGGQALDADRMTPELARAAGISVVHQDLGVFPGLSVAENMSIGAFETGLGGHISWRSVRRRARDLIERFEIPARPDTPLGRLTATARTQVAIARALGLSPSADGLLILDEPTAALPAHEVGDLLERLRQYAREGQGIVFVTHHLNEVLEVADRVTALRDGRNAGTHTAAELDEDRLVELIVGKPISRVFAPPPPITEHRPTLEVKNLSAAAARDVSFTLSRGEILGVAGLVGSGRTSLLRAIFGDLPVTSGEIWLEGERRTFRHPAEAIAAGVAMVPESRLADAVFASLPVAMNMSAANIGDYWRGGFIRNREMARDTERLMGEVGVKASSPQAPMSTLSGGNQQKAILGRWLRRRPSLFLLDEPTQGVDVGARAEIYRLIRDAVAEGTAALIVASDVEELAHVCDRVIVLRRGRLLGELSGEALAPDRVLSLSNQGGVPQ
jgi:ribose transport system ATP-binding protein